MRRGLISAPPPDDRLGNGFLDFVLAGNRLVIDTVGVDIVVAAVPLSVHSGEMSAPTCLSVHLFVLVGSAQIPVNFAQRR